jgi:hypothetical protein
MSRRGRRRRGSFLPPDFAALRSATPTQPRARIESAAIWCVCQKRERGGGQLPPTSASKRERAARGLEAMRKCRSLRGEE